MMITLISAYINKEINLKKLIWKKITKHIRDFQLSFGAGGCSNVGIIVLASYKFHFIRVHDNLV